ncbi:hypothetical protein [Maridesulfovibrio sp.]|uniref:hypothetical protein n=1 Tax=Maridesulfovibrio sp. TaxID=2795000 RepID=UPI0029CA3DA0|nr:hypothetical protein [Maridesulfovibrio sp.]
MLSYFYILHRHLKNITPVVVGVYTFILFLGAFFTFPFSTSPSDLMGVFFLGGGGALILETLSLLGLIPAYGCAPFSEGLIKFGLGAFFVWVAFDMSLAGQGTATIAVIFYVLTAGFYALTFRKHKWYSVVATGPLGSFDTFMEKMESSGAEQFKYLDNTKEGRHYTLNKFLVNFNAIETDRCTYTVSNLMPQNLKCLKKIFGEMEGITSIWEGLDFHSNCRVTNGNIQRIFDDSTELDEAYIYGNGLFLSLRSKNILSGIHGSLEREVGPGRGQLHRITVSFEPYPQKNDFFLNLNTHNPQELVKLRIVNPADGDEKIQCPELLGENISFSVVHEGPLDTFGSRLIFKKHGEDGREYFLISYSYLEGIIIKPISGAEAASLPTVSVEKYLDYWSCFTALDAASNVEEEEIFDPNIFMAPRGNFILLGYDESIDEHRHAGIFPSEGKTITEALRITKKSDPDNLVYQVYDENGDCLFATNQKAPVKREHFVAKMMRYSGPFWHEFFDDGYWKLLVGSYTLAWVALIPLFVPFMQENGLIFLAYGLIPIALAGIHLRLWGDLSLYATSRGGKLSCVLVGIFGTIAFTCLLAILVAFRVKLLWCLG